MTNSGIYQWFCLWRWCKMYNPGCAFVFWCFFTSAASKFCQNAITSTDASLRADVPISTAACVFYSLTCLAYNLATWVPHRWNKLSCSANVNLHCQLRIRKGICFDWEPEGLWNMSFHLLPAAVNGACVNTQGSVSKSFCALEFPSTSENQVA